MSAAPYKTESTAEQIEDAAARWVTHIDLHGSQEKWAHLDAWLASNPRHSAAFQRLSVAWRRADQLRQLAALGDEPDPELLSPDTRIEEEEVPTQPAPSSIKHALGAIAHIVPLVF